MVTAAIAPPVPVASMKKKLTKPSTELPQWLIKSVGQPRKISFDPKKHLNFVPPEKTISMKEIGLEGAGISPVAVSDPFPLFNQEAIAQMRAEAFSKAVIENCQVSSSFASHMIRNYSKYAKFAYEAWHNTEVLNIVSEIAGIALVPGMDFDVGHINVSFGRNGNEAVEEKPVLAEQNMAAFKWHHDSYPFVVVTMLSDCTDMVGGETAIRLGSGDVMKVRGPTMGTAVLMQGRYIEHQALKALGGEERLAMVTSFRPKSPFVKDETVLNGIRGITDENELLYWYSEYRYEILKQRFEAQRKKVLERCAQKADYDIASNRRFLEEQRKFIDGLLEQLVDTSSLPS